MASTEAIVQLCILILTLSLFFLVHKLRNQTTQPKTQTRNKTHQPELNRHITQATRHLVRAKSTSNRTQHARNALYEADQALSISPKDPSIHILRAKALQLMNHRSSAIRSLNSALSPPISKLLSEGERVDALVFRAEMKLEVNRLRRVDSAMEDLEEAMTMRVSGGGRDNVEALCLLGRCYEWKGTKDEAVNVFRKILDFEPDSVEALNGLDRLGP